MFSFILRSRSPNPILQSPRDPSPRRTNRISSQIILIGLGQIESVPGIWWILSCGAVICVSQVQRDSEALNEELIHWSSGWQRQVNVRRLSRPYHIKQNVSLLTGEQFSSASSCTWSIRKYMFLGSAEKSLCIAERLLARGQNCPERSLGVYGKNLKPSPHYSLALVRDAYLH